jgi:DNA-binding MarR family transcriptional regulator
VALLVPALLLASFMVPQTSGKTTSKWDSGDPGFELLCTEELGASFTRNITLPRNSDISCATVQIHGGPYTMNEGLENQTTRWPRNPSLDVLGDGSTEWAFEGTMGMQDRFSDNASERGLRWDAPGQTRSLDITVPLSKIRSASLTITNTDPRVSAYSMNIGDKQVWNRQSLSFLYNGTSFSRDNINYVTFGDVNGDKKLEMVAGGANGKVFLAKNLNGRWLNATVIDLQIQSSQRDITQVALGMLDQTPGLDIVAACADGNVYYLLNQGGAGLYSGASQLVSGTTGRMASVCLEDVNGDGSRDIVAGNLNGKFYVFLNSGEAAFDSSTSDGLKIVPGGNGQMNAVAVYDIDGDGNMDLIGANSNKNLYIVRCPSGSGVFGNAMPLITTAIRDLNSIWIEDVNGDGFKDLISASNDGRVYICLNLGAPVFGGAPGTFDNLPGHMIKLVMESGTNSLSTAVAKDLNGDGLPDIVALSYNTGQVFVALNNAGSFNPDDIVRPFSTGQLSRSLAVDDVDGDGDPDIAVANVMRMDVWLNDRGRFSDTVSGPAFVGALQDCINGTPAVLDRSGNPMVTCSLKISSRFPGALNFSNLRIEYEYTATANFTAALSAHMNATAGPYREGEMLKIPVVFSMESPGALNVTELRIDSEIGLVPIITFPTENSTLYFKEPVYLIGFANKDPDGTALNYTWTDILNGRFLGAGSRIKYVPTTLGNITIQLLVNDELHGKEASSMVHIKVVDRPNPPLMKIPKIVLSNREPQVGEKLTITVYVGNYVGTTGTGRVNVTNVSFGVYLDDVDGTPISTGIIPKVEFNRANSTKVDWYVQASPGTHKLILRIISADQYFVSTQYVTTITVHGKNTGPLVPMGYLVAGGGIAFGIGALAFFLGATEAGTYILFLFFMPLYSKMKPEEILDSFIRGKILGYIRANPGCHYNLIKQDLKLHNGTLIHNLDTLERNGYVKSVRDGLLRRFFPGELKIPQGRFYMNPMQEQMSKYIREHPGVSQAELTRGLYMHPHVVRYHIKILKKAEILRVEDEGGKTRLFLK